MQKSQVHSWEVQSHLEVVWTHEEVSNTLSHDTHDPLIKVLGLALGGGVCHLGVNQSSQTVDLQQEMAVSGSSWLLSEWMLSAALRGPAIQRAAAGQGK